MKYLSLLLYPLRWLPLTPQGILALGLAFLCYLKIGKEESDLIASVIGSGLLLFISVGLLSLLLSTAYLKKHLKITTSYPSEIVSGKGQRIETKIKGIRVPPLFSVKLNRILLKKNVDSETPREWSKVLSKEILLFGSFFEEGPTESIRDELYFPTRGTYIDLGYKVRFGDILGITKSEWNYPVLKEIKVLPAPVEIQPIPIMAATSDLGDLSHHAQERTGDLFDYKQYNSGDSLKRILWKTYARSQTLIVRHPEPAILPEGEVAMFVLATEEDDLTVACALEYASQLERQNIKSLMGFLGVNKPPTILIEDHKAACVDYLFVRDKKSKNLLSHGRELINFYEQLKNSNHHPSRILVFAPDRVVSTKDSDLNIRMLTRNIQENASNSNILLTLVLVPENKNYRETDNRNLANYSQVFSEFFPNKLINLKFKSREQKNSPASILAETDIVRVSF